MEMVIPTILGMISPDSQTSDSEDVGFGLRGSVGIRGAYSKNVRMFESDVSCTSGRFRSFPFTGMALT